jgi:hypothetical protein
LVQDFLDVVGDAPIRQHDGLVRVTALFRSQEGPHVSGKHGRIQEVLLDPFHLLVALGVRLDQIL